MNRTVTPRPPLSAYIHLPWCERKCPYCDFNSHEASDIPEAAYVDALLRDLGQEYIGESRSIETVFIGGGTPSLFSVTAIARLLEGLRNTVELAPGAEVTMEANPGSTDNERLAGYARAGVTRFSIGVQSFSDDALRKLGRIHDADTARAAARAAAGSGAASYNLDLMHGLPGQSTDDGLRDIEGALELAPPHLSWYQLTIEPNTRFYTDRPPLPAEEILNNLETRGAAMLEAAGYTRYEVSAWARAGQACQHNLNYWRFGDYLAIGAGAHGKRTGAGGEVLRYAKTRTPADYLRNDGQSRRSLRTLHADDLRGEFVMNALRLREGFALTLFEERTGLKGERLEPELSELIEEGLLLLENKTVRCSARGWRYLDAVVGKFF